MPSRFPPGRKNPVVAGLVGLSFAVSFIFVHLPVLGEIPSGNRTILLTLLLSAAAAILFPIKDEETSETSETSETLCKEEARHDA